MPEPVAGIMDIRALTDAEFELFRGLLYSEAGISLSSAKRSMVEGRLHTRLRHLGLTDYQAYFDVVERNLNGELQTAVNILTTNETCFFREPKHFDYLREQVLPGWSGGPYRIWSAASSTGEEAYSLAMLLAEHARTSAWEILGTDINTKVINVARSGQYPILRAKDIPTPYLKKYCLRGIGDEDGTFIIGPLLKAKVSFANANLQKDLSTFGRFDVIFLRNVMIYFDVEGKRSVVSKLVRQLKPGGHLIIGHSETLNGICSELKMVMPSVYRKR